MYHDSQSMGSAKNMVDALPDWNPNGVLTLMDSSRGYAIGARQTSPTGANLTRLTNQLYEPGVAGQSRDHWSFTMNRDSEDAFEFTIISESPTYPAAWPPSAGTFPDGSSFSFYMAQRIFSARGDGSNKGYSFLNVRHMSLVSRFGGGSNSDGRSASVAKLPRAFHEHPEGLSARPARVARGLLQ